MGWTWTLLDAHGAQTQAAAELLAAGGNQAAGGQQAADGQPQNFESQGDAESFIGECWRDLLAAGVDSVQLFDDDRLVYSMSLQPPAV